MLRFPNEELRCTTFTAKFSPNGFLHSHTPSVAFGDTFPASRRRGAFRYGGEPD